MKPLSERDENTVKPSTPYFKPRVVGMKPLSERDENLQLWCYYVPLMPAWVGMKPLSERDENHEQLLLRKISVTGQ